ARGRPPGGSGVPPMPGGSGNVPGFGMQGGPGGAQTPANKTPNLGLDRDRYLFVTDQSRHLPLAMTLAVDQSHLNEILVALANSRLRFQTTQVEFRREPAGGNSAAGNGYPLPSLNPPSGGSSGGQPST